MKKFLIGFLFIFPLFADVFHPLNLVKKDGRTLVERIDTPLGFQRIPAEEGSFADYIRNHPLKEAASPVLLYNGNQKENQEAHCGIFKLSLDSQGLQKSAGSIFRLYAEYLYKFGYEDKINFHLKNGSDCKWSEWKKNFRIDVSGNLKKWTKFENPPNKRQTFDSYLKTVLANTDITSMQIYDSEPTDFENLKIGDILMDMANQKDVCLVVDMCENSKTGEKAVLLAHGGNPAQEFHILKNPKRINDPWYYEEDFFVSAKTPEYLFSKDSWRHMKYLE